MRCKLLSHMDIKWHDFTEYMAIFGLPYTGISTTLPPPHHSSSDGKPRTFCSCGHDASEIEQVCPQCGGAILSVEQNAWGWHRSAAKSEMVGYKDINTKEDKWNYGVFTIEITVTSDTTSTAKMSLKDVFSIKDGKMEDFDSSVYAVDTTAGPLLSEKPTKVLADYLASTFTAAGLSVDSNSKLVSPNSHRSSSKISRADVIDAHCVETLDRVFTKKRFEEKPLTTYFLLETLFNRLCGGRGASHASEFSNDMEKLLEEINVPPMAAPILEQLLQTDKKNFSNFDSWSDRISHKTWEEIGETPICGLLFSRVRHGNMVLPTMVDILADVYHVGSRHSYYFSHEWTDETRELFIPFLKENFDLYGADYLTARFWERVQWLKENGYFLSEENLRTRNYHKLYNLRNFKKTLRNTDVEELIQTDPLLLISRIR